MTDALEFVIFATFALLAVAGGLTMIRLIRGPSLLDRVLALDLLSFIAVGLIVLVVIESGQSVLIDVALGVALVAFVATVAFAQFLEMEGRDE
ncbi:MAG: monovalent cation/H+ antiporter complex subunit F [Dehalococcoidia bacterium]